MSDFNDKFLTSFIASYGTQTDGGFSNNNLEVLMQKVWNIVFPNIQHRIHTQDAVYKLVSPSDMD